MYQWIQNQICLLFNKIELSKGPIMYIILCNFISTTYIKSREIQFHEFFFFFKIDIFTDISCGLRSRQA